MTQFPDNGRPTPPPRAAWDFDLEGCPQAELDACCFWEYALENQALKQAVINFREQKENMVVPGDEIANLTLKYWFGVPQRTLVDQPEFPNNHWLEIDPIKRQKKLTESSFSEAIASQDNSGLRLDPPSLSRMQAERNIWERIELETDKVLTLFAQLAKEPDSLRNFPAEMAKLFRPLDRIIREGRDGSSMEVRPD